MTALAFVAPALMLLAAAVEPGSPLATLGRTVIREDDFREHLASARSPEEAEAVARDPAARREVLEAYLDAVALAARGRQLGIHREARFRKARELAEQKLLAHALAERHRDRLRGAPVTEEELRRYHALHAGELAVAPGFTARQILVYAKGNPAFPERGRPDAQARARAEEALARLRAGEGWDTVARAWSDEPGTSQRGGLLRDAEFGHFAPEVEQAVRAQPLGEPGPVFRSAFGYHVLQVEARRTRRVPRPLEEVRELLADLLAAERSAAAREAFLGPVRAAAGLRVHAAARPEAPLLDARAVRPDQVIAELGGQELRESDFRWFLEDALLPAQRTGAWSRPGARRELLASFLDLRALAAGARREGLDRSEAFARRLALVEESLLREFTEARLGLAAPGQCTSAGTDRRGGRRASLDRVRAEVGLRLADR